MPEEVRKFIERKELEKLILNEEPECKILISLNNYNSEHGKTHIFEKFLGEKIGIYYVNNCVASIFNQNIFITKESISLLNLNLPQEGDFGISFEDSKDIKRKYYSDYIIYI